MDGFEKFLSIRGIQRIQIHRDTESTTRNNSQIRNVNFRTNTRNENSRTRRSEIIVLNNDDEIIDHRINGIPISDIRNENEVQSPLDLFDYVFNHMHESDEEEYNYDHGIEPGHEHEDENEHEETDIDLAFNISGTPGAHAFFSIPQMMNDYDDVTDDSEENDDEDEDEEDNEELDSNTQNYRTVQYNESNIQDYREVQDINDLMLSDDERGIVIDESENSDADQFYNSRRESFTTPSQNNNEYEKRMDITSEDKNYRYSTKSTTSTIKLPHKFTKSNFIFNSSQTTFNKFQQYNEFDDDFFILKNSPEINFENSLNLKKIGRISLKEIVKSKRYKNNLSCNITSDNKDYLAIGLNSEIIIYKYNPITNLPFENCCLRFNTKPSYTSSTDRSISTWPYFPHTINYMKSGEFNGKQIICSCIDDGFLLIWEVDTLVKYIEKNETSKKKDFNEVIKPKYKIKLSASLWGVDFKENIIVASDNSQSCVLLYYHSKDEKFYHVKTHQILHNIPDISILKINKNIIQVSCASISGEVVIFEFKFKFVEGPLYIEEINYNRKKQLYYTDPIVETMENQEQPRSSNFCEYNFERIKFLEPIVISRIVLGEDCWTVNHINSKWFLQVNSLQNVFGDSTIKEDDEINRILNESMALDNNEEIEDHHNDSTSSIHLGSSSNYQFFQSETIAFCNIHKCLPHDSSKFTNINDEYRRLHKQYKLQQQQQQNKNYQNEDSNFLIVSTGKKLGLFNIPSLFSPCATKTIFNNDLPDDGETAHANRLSILSIIPELSCIIAVSQKGLVTIMRLCTYRGIYGMRQEYVFPNVHDLLNGDDNEYRSIIGLSIRKKFIDKSTYILNIVYNDGLLLAYELS
ncbi:hypothetical protein KGF54_000604 [Candida jiufengensis]|uniref:uncharacterized protein n=1 Tax=Candida jiufengensis TaxID=497108 RepID=UPI002224287B|nr:uncharacterized protein KGF54_000604 [Candida jiufengensis]KAI5956985.1 hypothetical protein KGF54_000604 [Candida jiufengensis]